MEPELAQQMADAKRDDTRMNLQDLVGMELPQLITAIIGLWLAKKKVEALKLLRNACGIGLREAVEWYDALPKVPDSNEIYDGEMEQKIKTLENDLRAATDKSKRLADSLEVERDRVNSKYKELDAAFDRIACLKNALKIVVSDW